MVSKILFYLIQKGDNQITDAYRHEGGDETGELERMVDHVLANARRSGTVEVDGSHLGGVVGDEEIAVDGGEHGHQCQRRDAKGYAQGIEGAHGGSLREEHDAHEEQGDGEEEGILRDDVGDTVLEELDVAVEERVAHPGNTEDAHHGIHTGAEDVALHGIAHLGFTYNENEGGD